MINRVVFRTQPNIKMELFVKIVTGFQMLAMFAKRSILDVEF